MILPLLVRRPIAFLLALAGATTADAGDGLPSRVYLSSRWYDAKVVVTSRAALGEGWPLKDPVARLVCIPALASGGGFVLVEDLDGGNPRVYSVTGWSRTLADGRKFIATVPLTDELQVRHLFEGPDWNGEPLGPLIAAFEAMGCAGTPPADNRP
jgi:hypothetical protein